MARIADVVIDRLKAEVSLVRLIEAAGYALAKQGKDLAMRCPFHEGDDTPSFIVTPSKNVWHCFGCQRGGSVIDWVMLRDGVSFRHAVELLREGAFAPAGAAPVKASSVPKLAAPVAFDAEGDALLAQVIDYYHAMLKQSADGQAFLARRGLVHPEVIDTFRLGLANRTLGLRLPDKNRVAGAKIRGRLQSLGLYRANGREHFNGSLIVPVLDAAGAIAEVYGRKVTADHELRKGTAKHLYLPGPHRGVFNLAGWHGAEEVIVCEALLDALTFWCAGYRHVTSAFGVSGFTDELLTALVGNGIKRVLIAYDRDEAGDKAAEKLAPILKQHGIAAYRVLFPKGMDANDYALKVGPPAKALGLALRKAEPLGEGTPARDSVMVAVPVPLPGAKTQAEDADGAVVASTDIDASTRPCGDTPAPPSLAGRSPGVDALHRRTAPGSPLAAAVEVPNVASAAEPKPAPSPPPEPCSPEPMPAADIDAQVREHDVVLSFGQRRYRIRGLEKNLAFEVLRVNVLASNTSGMHVDTFDLYQAKARGLFIKQAHLELGVEESVIGRDLGQVLLKLELLQDDKIKAATAPKADAAPALSEADTSSALTLLRDPKLMDRIASDVEALGVVGEATNALVAYLACVSRKLDKPLAIIVQSTSAAGKSTLMDALLSLMPEAERVHYSAMTGQSLFYLGEQTMKHKILAIAEEEGVRQAAYALKLLQSQGELTIASTGKDPTSGQLVTQEYRVEGPVMLFLTTTAIDIDEELLNRCLVLTIDETREQTQAIHRSQRAARTLPGLLAGAQGEAVRRLHCAAQTLLRPLAVVNPYAEQLTFRSESTRLRRDHAKYLTLIDAIALLHQHQREVKHVEHQGQSLEYIEATLDDIALANTLAHDVLGRSLDELPPQTRRVLGVLDALVRERMEAKALARSEVRIARREVRAATGLRDTQVRVHLERLVELDYLLPHSGRNGQRYSYELAFDGDAASATVQAIGLADVAAMATMPTSRPESQTSRGKTPTSRGQKADPAGCLRAACGELAGTSRGDENPRNASAHAALPLVAASSSQNAPLERSREAAHRNGSAVVGA